MNTLLDMVQGILSSNDGDDVSSHTDTEEALKAANCIRGSYDMLVTSEDFEETAIFLEINASGDNTKPVLMTAPLNIDTIEWFRYDKKEKVADNSRYETVYPLNVDEFFDRSNNYGVSENNGEIESMSLGASFNNLPVYYYNDRPPKYYTLLDNTTLLFDGYTSSIESTLQNSKVMAYGRYHNDFVFSDTYDFPNLNRFTKLIIYNEAKRQFSIEDRQLDNPVAAQRARMLKIGHQKERRKIDKYEYGRNDPYNNYGRKQGITYP